MAGVWNLRQRLAFHDVPPHPIQSPKAFGIEVYAQKNVDPGGGPMGPGSQGLLNQLVQTSENARTSVNPARARG
jgi:hypothetical protein